MEEIIIQPKMSFGTGHHPTTHLDDSANAGNGFQRQKVLDMGCRNFRFGDLCQNERRKRCFAIDIDEWSVENSKENAERNNVELRIELGTAENLGKEKFDIILANINRNILISDIPTYVKDMNEGSELLLSGLCFFDVADILEVCTEQGLKLKNKQQHEEWSVCFGKYKKKKRSIDGVFKILGLYFDCSSNQLSKFNIYNLQICFSEMFLEKRWAKKLMKFLGHFSQLFLLEQYHDSFL